MGEGGLENDIDAMAGMSADLKKNVPVEPLSKLGQADR